MDPADAALLRADRERLPDFDPSSVPSVQRLAELLRREIERDGPVTFARFMQVALYDPVSGYYSGPVARPTREGDFLTAPELHPVFGRLVGRQLDEVWERLGRPSRFVVREHGAGAGTLGSAALAGMRLDGSPALAAVRYQPIEVNRHRLDELADRFASAGLADHLEEPEGPVVGVVLANELLDALPFHRLEVRRGEVLETYVGWDGDGFHDVPGPPSDPSLLARLADEGVALAEGQRAEVCLELDPWVAAMAASLVQGCAIVLDYGHPAGELYGTARHGGTLRAYVGQRVHADPYRHVGRQDVTAHVDLTALERAARAGGLDVLGLTTQAEFLAGLGIGDLLAEAGRATTEELAAYLELRAAVVRLLDPRALGGFRVMVLGRGLEATPVLSGLAYRLPARPVSTAMPSVARDDTARG